MIIISHVALLSIALAISEGSQIIFALNENENLNWTKAVDHQKNRDQIESNRKRSLNTSSSANSSEPISSISSGAFHVCVLFSNTKLIKCYGNNYFGQLGLGDDVNRYDTKESLSSDGIPNVDIGTGLQIDKIALGYYHTCASFISPKLIKCWGNNYFGQLGLGDFIHRGNKPLQMGDNLPFVNIHSESSQDVYVGAFHTCVLNQNKNLVCFGMNSSGQLGQGDRIHRGNSVSDFGVSIPFIDFGNNINISSVITGSSATHSCIVTTQSDIKCWGNADSGQLGYESKESKGDEGNEMGNFLPFVNLGTNKKVKLAFLGAQHTCAILLDDSIRCWGNNSSGQLGIGFKTNIGDEKNEMGNLMIPTNFGEGPKATSMSLGYDFTCALFDDSSIKCVGANMYGQLGTGNTVSYGVSQVTVGDYTVKVNLGYSDEIAKISSGYQHSCVLFMDSSIKCYGYNGSGQLGLGDDVNRGTQPSQLGIFLPQVIFN